MITKPITLERRVQREVKQAELDQETPQIHFRRALSADRFYARQTGSHLIDYSQVKQPLEEIKTQTLCESATQVDMAHTDYFGRGTVTPTPDQKDKGGVYA